MSFGVLLVSDDFNRRILSPDVSQSEFVELHAILKNLYQNYCAPTATDRIKFDDDIVDALREGWFQLHRV